MFTRKLRSTVLLAGLLALTASASAATDPAPAAASKAAVKAGSKNGGKPAGLPVTFGLTEALGTLSACKEARFDSDSIIALGAVLQENRSRVSRAPAAERMALMEKLVAEETAKANAWAKGRTIDCKVAAERGAAYWNRTIQGIAQEQLAEAQAQQAKLAAQPAAGQPAPAPAKKPAGAAVSLP
jgi:hypothetical protein